MTIARQGSRARDVVRRMPPSGLPRRWRDHRFVAAVLITMAVTATVSGATVAARPATSEAIATSSGSFGSVASDPSGPPSMSPPGDPDLAVPEPGAISHHVPEPVVPEPASRPSRRNDRSRDSVGPGRRRDSGHGTRCLPAGGRGGQPGLRNHLAAARRHRPGGVEPRAICRRGLAQRRPVHPADHWHPARRVPQRRCPRHRRRAPRRRPHLRPRGRADAVHPIDVGGLPRRRQRRRPIRPVQHLRRGRRHRELPLPGRRRSAHRCRSAAGGVVLQPVDELCVRGARSRGRIRRGCRHRGSGTASR